MAEGAFSSLDTSIHALFMHWPFAVDKLSGPTEVLIVLWPALTHAVLCHKSTERQTFLIVVDEHGT